MLLNLKTFIKQSKRLIYYQHEDYHLFTNGIVLYGCKDDNPNLSELMKAYTINSTNFNTNTFLSVLNGLTDNVIKSEVYGFEKMKNDLISCTNILNYKNIPCLLSNSYLRTLKKNARADKYVSTINFHLKQSNAFYAVSNDKKEFLFILPIKFEKNS